MALLPSNQRDQIMLIVCVLLLGGVYAYYQYRHTPKNETLDTIEERIVELEETNKSVSDEIRRGGAARLRDSAEVYGRMLQLMRRLVPVSNEVPALLEQISNAARQTGLELGPIRPLGIIPGEVFDTYRYSMGVTGSYHRIGQFLDNVGSLTRIMAPMNLTLRPSQRAGQRARQGEALLDAGFEVQTYVAKVGPPATPPAGGQ